MHRKMRERQLFPRHIFSYMDEQFGEGDPEVKRIIAEMNALNTALQALDNPQEVPNALRLVRQVRETHLEPETFEGFVILVAMSKIVAAQAPTNPPRLLLGHPWTTHVFEQVGLAWVAWTAQRSPEALRCIYRLRDVQKERELGEDRSGAIQLLALYDWARAVEALANEMPTEAERFFKRATAIGASFGTESHPVVLWTMAASLFPPTI
jgi:hypothetical protein